LPQAGAGANVRGVKAFLAVLPFAVATAFAQVPDNLVVEGVPAAPPALQREVSRYLEFRTAAFQSWHPRRREMLITTRFADTAQLHLVKTPGGARRQLSFLSEPVSGGSYQPKDGNYVVFAQDAGGGEFFQLYRLDADGRVTLLTDGKSRNMGARWAKSGKQLAYTSTRRTGKDTDLYVLNPADPKSDRLVAERKGGGWSVAGWSADETKLLVAETVSINESHLHVLDVKSGQFTPLTPATERGVAYAGAQFSADGTAVFTTTDKDSEFRRLARLDVATGKLTVLTPALNWDVEAFELSPDGKTLAYSANEDGASVLHLLDVAKGAEQPAPKLPLGVLAGLEWHSNGRDLGFSLAHANSPADAYSLDVTSGTLTRWTESETGGLDASQFRQPSLIRTKSFDGLTVSAFVYRPDPAKFPGKRPAIIQIHGGPESQSRPVFQARNNYYLDELGVALVVPNVRGSAGYGKTFLTRDNGFRREDSVKDIGAIIDWVKAQPDLDGSRIAVTGGSYGGYMTLAALTHYSDRLKCGVDVVGISNFVTFLENTQDYRRDLRRVEYGDERDPAMRAHLEKISPTTNVKRIGVPLFVVQGKNDPRVPVTEAEQMVKAVRANGGACWYLMAKDEGHGFQKKKNADFQFLSTIQFWQQHLLAEKVD
jgi:dipeptidyl aminopeptidase/acylaminoacyl peptidase